MQVGQQRVENLLHLKQQLLESRKARNQMNTRPKNQERNKSLKEMTPGPGSYGMDIVKKSSVV